MCPQTRFLPPLPRQAPLPPTNEEISSAATRYLELPNTPLPTHQYTPFRNVFPTQTPGVDLNVEQSSVVNPQTNAIAEMTLAVAGI